MRASKYRHEFVEFIPENMEKDVLYVSMAYATAVHRCFCGCGAKVVTPITPTDWQLTFDGESVSLDPSVGSWSLACRSHYWLDGGKVEWAPAWTQSMIDRERARDRRKKDDYYSSPNTSAPNTAPPERPETTFWHRAVRYVLGQSDS